MLMMSSEQENHVLIQIQHFQSKAVFVLQSHVSDWLLSVCQSPHIPKKALPFINFIRKIFKMTCSSHSVGITVQYWQESQGSSGSFPFESFTCIARVRD